MRDNCIWKLELCDSARTLYSHETREQPPYGSLFDHLTDLHYVRPLVKCTAQRIIVIIIGGTESRREKGHKAKLFQTSYMWPNRGELGWLEMQWRIYGPWLPDASRRSPKVTAVDSNANAERKIKRHNSRIWLRDDKEPCM